MNWQGMPIEDWGVLGAALVVLVVGAVIILWPSGKHHAKKESNGGCFFVLMWVFAVVAFIVAWIYGKVTIP